MGKAGVDRLLEHFKVCPHHRHAIRHLANRLKDWDPIINEVIRVLPNVEAYPLQSSPWMRDLVRDDGIAFVGDAAHRKRDSHPYVVFPKLTSILLQPRLAHTEQAVHSPSATSEHFTFRFGELISRAQLPRSQVQHRTIYRMRCDCTMKHDDTFWLESRSRSSWTSWILHT